MLHFYIATILLCALQTSVEASPAVLVKKAATPPEACTATWGWSGFVRGTNPWGAVLNPTQSASLSSELSSACATYSAVTTPTTSTVVVSTSTSTSTSSTTSASTSKPTTTSTSTSTTSSSSATSTHVTTPSSSSSSSTSSSASSTSSSTSPTTSKASTSSPPAASSSSSAVTTPSTSTSTTSTTTGSTVSSSDISTYLSTHNTVRAQHGANALVWNNTLSAAAQKWANGCVFQHSGGTLGPFGENLAAGTGAYTITSAVTSWTNEVSQYNASNPVPSHFTQVVWKATTQLGCAVATCNGIFPASYGPAQYYVCEYYPQGNVIGEFGQNVQA